MVLIRFFGYRVVMATKSATVSGHPDWLAELQGKVPTDTCVRLAHKGCLALGTVKGSEHILIVCGLICRATVNVKAWSRCNHCSERLCLI